MADLFRLSASEAAVRIREGKLTSEALVRSCLGPSFRSLNLIAARSFLNGVCPTTATTLADRDDRQGTGPATGCGLVDNDRVTKGPCLQR
jgi:hypothetical protein